MKKKTIILSVLIALVVIGGAVWALGGSKAKHQITYATAPVAKGEISESVTATGTIEPVTEVEVGTQVSGIIDQIYVDYNSVVKQGQLIAMMDRVTLESDNYESSQAALAKAERNLSYTVITAPIDGIVISKDVEEGQTVASGFETPTLFTIAADLTQMQVVADVDEADIGGVAEGQRVTFTVDAYPNDTFEGTVTQIRLGESSDTSAGTSTSSTVVTYEVVITAPNPDLKLKPRLTANVTIYTLDRHNVLCVPARALRFTPEAPLITPDAVVNDCPGEHKLWTREGNTFTAHAVQVGISNGISTEILGGISEGTQVVTEATLSNNLPMANEAPSGGERSPFMPGPPGSDKKDKQKK